MITDAQLEKAMNYLAETDELEADLYMESQKAEQAWKNTKDAIFLSYSEGSIAEKQARAANAAESTAELERWLNAQLEHRKVANKRKRAVLTIDVWRSLNANKRQGQ